MSPNLALLDTQDQADAVVAHAVANHIHPRAMARAILRSASVAVARLETDQAAADVCFSRYSRHTERASREAVRGGSRR